MYRITHTALSALLNILADANLDLPKDARTLLKTPSTTNVNSIAGGEHYHRKITKSITEALYRYQYTLDDVSVLTLNINIDRLPLFLSCSTQLWPILGVLKELQKSEPFIYSSFLWQLKTLFC